MKKIILIILAVMSLSQYSIAIDIELDGTQDLISGDDCQEATYRFGTEATYQGHDLDLIVSVEEEDNEYSGPCIGITDNVLSVRIKDTDRFNELAYVNLKVTIVQKDTFTPVVVDSINITNFDLDRSNNLQASGTDDVYYKDPSKVYLSSRTNVTQSSGLFYNDYNTKLKGQSTGNCDDSATLVTEECRAGVVYNNTSTFYARVQNDNAYSQYYNYYYYHRLIQFSFEIKDLTPLMPEQDVVECSTVSYSTGEDQWIAGSTPSTYENDQNMIKNLSMSNAEELKITVSGETESNYDWLYIYDKDNNPVYQKSGNLNNTPFTISGSELVMKLTSDGSVRALGGTVTIEGLGCTPPTLSIDDEEIEEGDSDTKTLSFTVTLDKQAGSGVSFDYQILNGDNSDSSKNATSPSDYQSSTQHITLEGATQTFTIDVPIYGDEIFEEDESFRVVLSNITGTTNRSATAIGTIINDDEEIKISITDSDIVEGNVSTRELHFTVTLTQDAPNGGITVQVQPHNITANEGEDYTRHTSSISFDQGEREKTIYYLINGDTDVEEDESFSVELHHPQNAVLDEEHKEATGTIINDDIAKEGAPFSCSSESYLTTGSSSLYSLDLTDGSNEALKNNYSTTHVNAIGYNVKDDFIWGWDRGTQKVMRLDANYTMTTYGTNIPIDLIVAANTGFTSGDVSKDGILYLAKPSADPRLHKIDLNSGTPVYLGSDTLTTENSVRFGDFAINPKDGYLYTSYNKRLYRISTSAVVEDLGAINGLVDAYFHSFVFDVDGNIYFYSNANDKKVFKLDLSDHNNPDLDVEVFTTLEWVTASGDGARCANAKMIKKVKPIADYHFDECSWSGSAREVKDSSPNNHHGKAKSGADTDSDGKINRGAKFEQSSNQYVEINGFDDIFGASSNEFAITVWIRPSSLSSAQTNHHTKNTFFAKASVPKNDNIEIGVNPDGTLHIYLDTKNKDRYADFGIAGDIAVDKWNFIVVSYKNGKVKVEINDNSYSNNSTWAGATKIDQAVGSPITIGASIHIDNFFDGKIDEVKIFSKELSQDQIDILKNETGESRETIVCENNNNISGKVYQDENSNNSFDGADSGIANIEIKLIKDENENGIFEDNIDTLQESISSNSNGDYLFENLSTGKYLIVVNDNDQDLPPRYALNSDKIIPLNLVADSGNNNFAFAKESAQPVNCVENGLMFQNKPTDISYLDLADGSMNIKKADISTDNINGAGYNKKDGYYWGYNYTRRDGTISRIGQDSDGELVIDHFKIPDLTISSYTGDIDDNGHFYIKEAGNSRKVSVIDLDPESSTYLQKIRDFNLGENLSIADWGFNPQDDKLYAVTNGKRSNYLYKIEPSDGHIISKRDTNLTDRSYGFGASFFDKDGFYYIYDNGSGQIFRIDVDESPIPIPFATGGTVSLNDGAMCTDTDIRFDFGDLPFATKLIDDGARHRIRTSVGETHYMGEDVTTENNGKPSTYADRDEYDDGVTVNHTNISLQNFKILSIDTLHSLTVKTHGDGYLNAWIDWNRDGDFNASEQIADSLDGSSGTVNITLQDIPDIYFNGEPIYARFRYSSKEDLNATGTAPDGEVEDYAIDTAHYPNVRIESDIAKVEGDEDEITEFTFRVNIDRSGINPMQRIMNSGFYFIIEEDTATLADQDYILPAKVDGSFMEMGGFVAVLPNTDHFEITVRVKGDNRVEPNERFFLKLYSPDFMNIRKNKAIGTIVNDDILVLNIERTNSESTPNSRELLYTQITGRDFDYSVIPYDQNDQIQNIKNTTVKIELIDRTSNEDNASILYKYYAYIGNETSRFDVINSEDLKIDRATKDAEFRISSLVDENGSLVEGQYDTEESYNQKNSIEGNSQVTTRSKDNFAIRPAGFKMMLWADDGEYRDHLATNNQENAGAIMAGYNYELNISAITYKEQRDSIGYNSKEVEATLLFNDNLSCHDKNDSKRYNYNFVDGRFVDTQFKHTNVGKYKMQLVDQNWSIVDYIYTDNPLKQGCIVGSSEISNDPNEKSGCNIGSAVDLHDGNSEYSRYYNLKLLFQPYSFDLSDLTITNLASPLHPNYLYMNDIDNDRNMAIKISGKIKAIEKGGKTTTNFTNGCQASDVKLSMDYQGVSENGEFNSSAPMILESKEHDPIKYQKIYTYNGDYLDLIGIDQDIFDSNTTFSSYAFKDDLNGTVQIDIFYNIKKSTTQRVNPVKLKFTTMSATSKNASSNVAWTQEKDQAFYPRGDKSFNREFTFYQTRVVASSREYEPTDKKVVDTELAVEVYCDLNRSWCLDEMNMGTVGRNTQRTDYGWYIEVGHTDGIDGDIINLINDNPNNVTTEPTGSVNLINGRNANVRARYIGDDMSTKEKAIITIETSSWLNFIDNIYSVTFKKAGDTTGEGERGHERNATRRIKSNGKLDW